jgi:hypothetical protein
MTALRYQITLKNKIRYVALTMVASLAARVEEFGDAIPLVHTPTLPARSLRIRLRMTTLHYQIAFTNKVPVC